MYTLSMLLLVIGGTFAADNMVMGEKECKYSEYAMVFHNSKGYNTSEYMYKKVVAMKLMKKAGKSFMYNRAGLAVYNGDKQMTYYCDQTMKMEAMLKNKHMKMEEEMKSYTMNDGEVNWEMAMQKGKQILMSNGCGERSDVHSKVVFLFLNGADYVESAEMMALAKDMEEMKYKIIIIVIGPSDAAYSYLMQMASEYVKVYKVLSMKHLAKNEMMMEKMVEPICKHMNNNMPKCEAYESMYSALTMGEYEVSMFPGDCAEDKMKYAMEMVTEQIKSIAANAMEMKKTRMILQRYVHGKSNYMADLVFEHVHKCTMMIECKLPGWIKMLQKKMSYMKKKMYIVNNGWKAYMLKNMNQEENW